MGILQYAMAANYGRFYNDLKEISKTNHKPAWLMFIDAGGCFIRYRAGLQDYLNFRFYEKKHKERKEYVTTGDEYKIYKKIASIEYAEFFSNKLNFHKNFAKYAKREYFSPEDTYENFEKFIEGHPVFVKKPIYGLGGGDVEKVKAEDIKDKREFYEKMKDKKEFIEELIVQNEEWAKLSPNSTNTLRVMTSAVNGQSRIMFVAARIGSGKSIMDNFHQGGQGVLVDIETGKLVGNGIDKKLNESECSCTGVKFDGFQVPYWEEVKKMTLEAALVNDKVNLIGWDVAITPNGPLIIESNRGPGWDLPQVLIKKGGKYLMDEVLKEVETGKISS